eukprot:SAG11_NODE_1862_length_4154_cov_7.221208_4_plen_173_part_00
MAGSVFDLRPTTAGAAGASSSPRHSTTRAAASGAAARSVHPHGSVSSRHAQPSTRPSLGWDSVEMQTTTQRTATHVKRHDTHGAMHTCRPLRCARRKALSCAHWIVECWKLDGERWHAVRATQAVVTADAVKLVIVRVVARSSTVLDHKCRKLSTESEAIFASQYEGRSTDQ